jgi:hypothetical protein
MEAWIRLPRTGYLPRGLEMSIKLAMELWFTAQEKGGGTFDRRSEKEYDGGEGYVVGGVTEPLIIRKSSRPIESVERIAEWLDKTDSTYVGSWVDNDLVYFDGCDIRLNKEEAIQLGKFYNQIAIYDISAGEEIRLEDS